MGRILKHWHISASLIFSIVLIIGAYAFARSIESPNSAQASEETELLNAIAKRDSDNDGLPDWEEALYGTDSHVADSLHLGMTDGEAVAQGLIVPKAISDITMATSSSGASMVGDDSLPPAPADGTLTAAFAKNFFTFYLIAKQANGGGDLSEAQMSEVSNQALQSLSSAVSATPDFKSIKDLNISGSGPDALKAFAVSAERVLLANTSDATTSEINYLKSAIQNNDNTAFPHLLSLAKAYRSSAVGLAAIPVPAELADDNLKLINAMARISGIITDFARVDTDPLATILALQQYPQAVLDLGTAFINIGNLYKKASISLTDGSPGASFVNLISDVADQQATEGKKP